MDGAQNSLAGRSKFLQEANQIPGTLPVQSRGRPDILLKPCTSMEIDSTHSSRKSSNSGLLASSTPIVTRLRASTPREKMSASARSCSSRSSIISSTYASFSELGTYAGCRSQAENWKASRTVALPSCTSSCSASEIGSYDSLSERRGSRTYHRLCP